MLHSTRRAHAAPPTRRGTAPPSAVPITDDTRFWLTPKGEAALAACKTAGRGGQALNKPRQPVRSLDAPPRDASSRDYRPRDYRTLDALMLARLLALLNARYASEPELLKFLAAVARRAPGTARQKARPDYDKLRVCLLVGASKALIDRLPDAMFHQGFLEKFLDGSRAYARNRRLLASLVLKGCIRRGELNAAGWQEGGKL